MFYTAEEIRQMLLADPESYFSVAARQAKKTLHDAGHIEEAKNSAELIPLTEACYHFLAPNGQGDRMVVGIPGYLFSIRESLGEKMWARFAVATAVENYFTIMHDEIEVMGFYAENERGEQVARLLFCRQEEYAMIRKILQIAPIKKGSHLSLVVDNVNTVEALAASLAPSIEITQDKLVELLRDNVSTSLMPSAKVTHYNHRVPRAVTALDDGDFFRQLASMPRSGFFYRDALKKGEIYVVLKVVDDTFVVGLKSLFALVSQNGRPNIDMGERSFIVDRRRLMQEIISL